MATDWWADGIAATGAVANFTVAAVAMWAIGRQRRDALADRADDQAGKIKTALVAAELAAYEIKNTWYMLEAHARSQAKAQWTSAGDYNLHIRNFEKRAGVLGMLGDPRLPIPLLDHIHTVHRLLLEAIEVLTRHSGREDPQFGQAVVGDLLYIHHTAEIEHQTNSRLFMMLTGKPLFTAPVKVAPPSPPLVD